MILPSYDEKGCPIDSASYFKEKVCEVSFAHYVSIKKLKNKMNKHLKPGPAMYAIAILTILGITLFFLMQK